MKRNIIFILLLSMGLMAMGCEQAPRFPCNEMDIYGLEGVDICSMIDEEGVGPECNMAKTLATELECQLALGHGDFADVPQFLKDIILEYVCPNIAEANIGVCSELGLAGDVCAEDADCAAELICNASGKCE